MCYCLQLDGDLAQSEIIFQVSKKKGLLQVQLHFRNLVGAATVTGSREGMHVLVGQDKGLQ